MWPWCRDHTYTVIWTEHGQREASSVRDAEPGPGPTQCRQASHCVQSCRGEHFAVLWSHLVRGTVMDFVLLSTFEWNFMSVCQNQWPWSMVVWQSYYIQLLSSRGTITLTSSDLSLEIERPRDYAGNWVSQLGHEGKVLVFADVEKCSEPWIMFQQVRITRVFSGPVLQYSWLVQSCGDNKCINDKISLEWVSVMSNMEVGRLSQSNWIM